MASFFLMDKKFLQFSKVLSYGNQSLSARQSEKNIKVEIVPFFENDESRSFMEKILGTGNTQLEMDLDVQIMLPGGISAIPRTGILQVQAVGQNHIFEKIFHVTTGRITMNCLISGFVELLGPNSSEDGETWEFEGIELNRHQSFKASGLSKATLYPVFSALATIEDIPLAILDEWRNGKPFGGVFTISIYIPESPLFHFQVELDQLHKLKCKEMFETSVETNLKLQLRFDKIVKCHKGILAVHSGVLSEILEKKKKRTKLDLSNHLSKKCMRALLAFMYYKDLSKIFTSIEFTLEVLTAAVQFQIDSLIPPLQKYLATKSSDKFSADEGVRLYVIIKSNPIDTVFWNIEDDDDEDDENFQENQEEEEEGSEEEEGLEEENQNSKSGKSSETGADQESNDPQHQLQQGTKRPLPTPDGQDKRLCGENDENRQELSTSLTDDYSAAGTSTGVALQNDQDDDYSAVENNNDSDYFQDLIEQQAEQIILWHLRNNKAALLASTEYKTLSRDRLSEISTFIIENFQA